MLAVLAIAYLSLAVWAIRLVVLHPWDGITLRLLTGTVQSVHRLGPAFGLIERGDTITAVDGVPTSLAAPLYAGRRSGDKVQYTVARGGTELSVSVRLARAPSGVLVQGLVPIISAGGVWLLGCTVLVWGVRTRVRTYFFLFCLVFAMALSSGAISAIGPLWASSLFNLCLWWLLPLSIHLHLYFPDTRRATGKQVWLPMLYGVALVASIPYLIWPMDTLRDLEWYPAFNTSSRLALAGGLVGALVLVIWGHFEEPSAAYRRGARLLMLSSGVAFVPLVMLGLLSEVVLGYTLVPYWALIPLLLAIPAGYGYAILRHRLMRLDRFVNRTIAHVIAFVVTASWVVVLSSWIRSRRNFARPASALIDLGVVLVVGALFSPTLGLVQRLVDWVFYGGWYHPQDVVEQVVAELEHVAEPAALSRSVCDTLCTAMKLRCTALVLTDLTHLSGLAVHSDGGSVCDVLDAVRSPTVKLPVAGRLCGYFGEARRIVASRRLRQQLGELPDGIERQLLDCDQIRLWVPLWEGDTLLGLLGIGDKLGGDYFGYADQQALGLVANHVAKTIRNLELAAQLASRISEVNALHQRLVYLREEERKDLARELHDQVIQGLVSLQFQIAHVEGESRLPLYESIGQLVAELRAVCRGLRPPVLDSLGLVPAVRSHVRERARSTGMQIKLEIDGDEERELPEPIALTVFRALQEALANVHKHATANQVGVRLAFGPDALALVVRDDGRGFEVPASLGSLVQRDRFGLVGLRERLDLVRGTMQVRSVPGQGTELSIRVPLAEPTVQDEQESVRDDRALGDG
jgi:signal transduction histidine kinase